MRFFLNFKSDNYGKKEIDEPFEFEKITFSLKQKPNGMGRDMAFGADKNMLEFTDQADHQLKQLLYYNRRFGFESDVELTIEVDDENKYICDLDFKTADTDGLTYFKCQVVEDSKLQIINARNSTKVNLFADTDIDGNYIAPLFGDNMFLNAIPVYQVSKWEFQGTGLIDTSFISRAYNPCLLLSKSEIEDTYTFLAGNRFLSTDPLVNIESFKMVKATTNLSNIQISIKNIENTLVGAINRLVLYYSGIRVVLKEGVFSGDIFYNIPYLQRDDEISIFFELRGTGTVKADYMEISAQSRTFSSVVKSIRLIDVMKQVIKSISGLGVTAPTFDVGGLLYDNRLVDGNLLRGINTRAFSVSLEDIEKSLTEFKADFEIGSDGKIFFGLENEFYRNEEMMFFPATQFSEMHKTFNPKYTVNEFHYLYKTFQSQKEIEETNSSDEVHGEAKYSFFAKKVENKKVVEIEWIRSPLLIEQQRRKAFEITTNTSAQEDDGIFIIDSIPTIADKSISDVYTFSHTYNVGDNRLILRNDNSVNFIALGIVEGSEFIIKTPDVNAATYSVFSVNATELQLTRTTPGMTSGAGDGIRQTQFIYFIDADYIPFTNYTNENFTSIKNINGADSYSNLRYSARRNINNFWNSYLAAANLYWKDKPIRNFWYKNNPECETTYLGNTVLEGSDIQPTDPIVSPVMYEDIVFSDVEFSDFIILTNKIRSIRGYIRAIDNNFRVIKLFPVDVIYNLKDRLLSIKAEEKFEPTSMTIVTEVPFITINSETRVLAIDYEIKDNEVYIYDETRQLLYNPVYWMEISINGAIPPNIETLKTWLDLLTTP